MLLSPMTNCLSVDSIDSIDIFFLEAMWIAHTQSLLFSFVCVCVSPLCNLQSLATAPSNRNHNDRNNNNRNNNNSSQNNNNDNAPNNSLSKKRRSRPQKTQQSNGGDLSDSSSSSSDQRSPRNNKNRRPRKKKSNNNNNKNNNNNNNNGPQQQLILSEKEQAKYVAMDCEMVGVGCGGFQSSLARVVMVDWNGQVLLDQYVRPSEPVTDYRTFVSGITKQELEQDSVVDLDTCRTKVLEILQQDNDHHDHHNERILVGHGLKSDLMALGIRYPWYLIRDTAKWEPYMKTRDGNPPPATGCTMAHHNHHDGGSSSAGAGSDGTGCTMFLWPRKLKELCHDKLHRDIQCIGQAHCPVEDAIAALDLYKLARLKWEKTMIYKINKTRQITEQQHKQQEQQQPRQFLKPSPNLLQTR